MHILTKRIIDAKCKDDGGDWIYTLQDLSMILLNQNKAARKSYFKIKDQDITYQFIYLRNKDFKDWSNEFHNNEWIETYIGSDADLEKIMTRDSNTWYIVFLESRPSYTHGRRLTFRGVYIYDRTEYKSNYYQLADTVFDLSIVPDHVCKPNSNRKTNRQPPTYTEKSVTCKICGTTLTDTRIGNALHKHLDTYHNVDAKSYYIKYVNPNAQTICPFCGTPNKFYNAINGYSATCGNKECTSKRLSLVMSSTEVQQKKVNTTLERYGVEHHLQNPEIMAKQVKTNIEHLGVEHALQDVQIKNKMRESLMQGHTKNTELRRQATLIQKYGTNNSFRANKEEDLTMNITPLETLGKGEESVCIFYYDTYKKSVPDGEAFACKICAIPHTDYDKYFVAVNKFLPESPIIGLTILTDSSVELKTTIQFILNARKKQLETAPSSDWYNTTIDEVKNIYELILGK